VASGLRENMNQCLRKESKWVLLVLIVLASLLSACSPEQPPLTQTPTPAPEQLPTAPMTLNPVEEYAQSLGFSDDIIKRLKPLGEDGIMNDNEKTFIDYLSSISKADTVSPEVLKLAPANYKDEVIKSLQTKAIEDTIKDGISQDEAKALKYLSTFQAKIQRDLIEFGLDGTLVNYLVLNSSSKDQTFAQYAVENKLCIEDHLLTDLEKSFLQQPEKYSQALLDEYLSQLQQAYPELATELKKLPDLRGDDIGSKTVTSDSQTVYLLVSSTISEALKPWTDRWIEDVSRTGVKVLTKTIATESPDEIRKLLRETPNLNGCLMVGDIPVVKYEMDFTLEGKPYHEEFPTDLYYMDLDGNWLDSDNDGLLDTHTGNLSPEIWVGRLKASGLPALGDEIDLLRNYFDKDHLYRISALTLPHRALMYIDDYNVADVGRPPMTYVDVALQNGWEPTMHQVYENTVTITKPEVTTARDYLQRLDEGWSLVRLLVHSGGFGHHFMVNGEWDGEVHSSDIVRADPKVFFYTIVSCGDFDYTVRDFIGGCYVFSKSFSLVGIGDSGVHDFLVVVPDEFFPRLKSECFGSAFLHYLQECVKRNARVDSVHNAIMIGDPLLRPVYNGQDSDGDGLTDQYELSIGLDPRKVDSNQDGVSDLEEAKFKERLHYMKVDSVEAIEDISNLYLSATSSEVKEAFDLMIKGGTPDPSDYEYEVPNYNTELEVLYKLAEQNEFKKNDTVAQSVAADNGLWVTIGDDAVREAVYKDTNDLLNFFRETNEIQKARGYNQLEDYPLEAKVCLAWTGNETMKWNPLKWQPVIPTSLVYYSNQKLSSDIYEKDSVSISTLQRMREIAHQKDFWKGDLVANVEKVEDYLWIPSDLWVYRDIPDLVLDENGLDAVRDVDWQFNRYLQGLPFIGSCGTEAGLVDAWLKSIGIASINHWVRYKGLPIHSHAFILYYDPKSDSYKSSKIHFDRVPELTDNRIYDWYLYLPPVNQKEYLWNELKEENGIETFYGNYSYVYRDVPVKIMRERLLNNGIPSMEIKHNIFYSR
jgi:hypothetical protein